MPIPLRIVPAIGSYRDAALRLCVHSEQRAFVSAMPDTFADIDVCPGSEALAILEGDTVVGFVRIERNVSVVTGRPAPGSLGLRSFLIDATQQGRGLGAGALEAIRQDLSRRYPDRDRIVLTVNLRNASAVRLYGRAGYVDDGQLYHGGDAGPQHVLWRPLISDTSKEP
ncbi:GNAT family N-acetyltransferase [Luteibacter rhizovicinus]|nr:GNAT family N-acetyltransferase [Luteibacter rhizovicinus]